MRTRDSVTLATLAALLLAVDRATAAPQSDEGTQGRLQGEGGLAGDLGCVQAKVGGKAGVAAELGGAHGLDVSAETAGGGELSAGCLGKVKADGAVSGGLSGGGGGLVGGLLRKLFGGKRREGGEQPEGCGCGCGCS